MDVFRLRELRPAELAPLLEESVAEGYRFLRRLEREWASGANRFDRAGEILLAARHGGRLIAVCGLNVDPYTTDPGVGRLRHLYVSPRARRAGLGATLVTRVLTHGRRGFGCVRLRTDTGEAAAFYARMGFEPVTGDAYCTHRKWLRAT